MQGPPLMVHLTLRYKNKQVDEDTIVDEEIYAFKSLEQWIGAHLLADMPSWVLCPQFLHYNDGIRNQENRCWQQTTDCGRNISSVRNFEHLIMDVLGELDTVFNTKPCSFQWELLSGAWSTHGAKKNKIKNTDLPLCFHSLRCRSNTARSWACLLEFGDSQPISRNTSMISHSSCLAGITSDVLLYIP